MSRFSFDNWIKLSIIKLIVEGNFSLKGNSKEFNIYKNILYHWFKAYVKYGGRAFLCKGNALFSLLI